MTGTGDEELVRILDRQRLQHDGIEETEDRRRRADAEREREHCDDCEAGILQQRAKCVAKVLEHGSSVTKNQ